MIHARGIGRRVGATWALADLTFDVAPGECLRVTGRPGSGRSLLLRLLATHVPLSAGRLRVDGLDWYWPAGENLASNQHRVDDWHEHWFY